MRLDDRIFDAKKHQTLLDAFTAKTELDAEVADEVHDEEMDYSDVDGDDDEEMEDIVEEVTEMEMLAMLEEQEPSLRICRRLMKPITRGLSVIDENHVESLKTRGWFSMDGVMHQLAIDAVYAAAQEFFKSGRMQPASALHSNDDDPFRDRRARGDSIMWYLQTDAYSITPGCIEKSTRTRPQFKYLTFSNVLVRIWTKSCI
jgi:hypothetical protein